MEAIFQHALRSLPHGPEFRFIDNLVALDPGRAGKAQYNVRGDEPFLRGHFPGTPIFPGVLLLEGAAQLAGIVAQCDPDLGAMPGLKLTAVRSAKIVGSARPGDVIEFTARVTGRLGRLVQAEIRTTVKGDLVLEGHVVLSGDQEPAGT